MGSPPAYTLQARYRPVITGFPPIDRLNHVIVPSDVVGRGPNAVGYREIHSLYVTVPQIKPYSTLKHVHNKVKAEVFSVTYEVGHKEQSWTVYKSLYTCRKGEPQGSPRPMFVALGSNRHLESSNGWYHRISHTPKPLNTRF